MPFIRVETIINAARPLVFDLARDVIVHAQTVQWTRERIVGAKKEGKLELDDEVVFEAVHFGIRQRLTARIIEYHCPELFVDEMLFGAFKSLTHVHRFHETAPNQTLMLDELTFTSPLGVLGKIADAMFLARYMRRFLEMRNVRLKAIAESM